MQSRLSTRPTRPIFIARDPWIAATPKRIGPFARTATPPPWSGAADEGPIRFCGRYGAGPHRAPWHTRIHQVPSGKHAPRSPAVQAASARAYCALNARSRFTASVAVA